MQTWKPHKYQVECVEMILYNVGAGVFARPGLGKSSISLAAIDTLINAKEIRAALIVAPLRVCHQVWPKEVKKWTNFNHLSVGVIHGTPREREAVLREKHDVYVINFEGVEWLIDTLAKVKRWPFDMVVVDESSKIKNHKAKRTVALLDSTNKFKRRVILTGTPSTQGAADLFSQIKLLDEGVRLGSYVTAFRKKYLKPYLQRVGGGQTITLWEPTAKTADMVKESIKDICRYMAAEDYLDMPELMFNTVPVALPASSMKDYKALEKDFYAKINGKDVTAVHAAAAGMKLRQLCGGAAYDEDGAVAVSNTAKLDALLDLVEEQGGEPVIVAVAFKHEAERIAAMLKKELKIDAPYLGGGVSTKRTDEICEAWNAGQLQVLLAHPACLHPDTEVLTEHRGWQKLINVTLDDRVFDGVEFVRHSGCMFSGVKPVVDVFGVLMTPDHKLLINDNWLEASHVRNNSYSEKEACYAYAGNDPYLSEMLSLRSGAESAGTKRASSQPREAHALSAMHTHQATPNDWNTYIPHMARHENENAKPARRRLSAVWCKGARVVPSMAQLRQLLRGYVAYIRGRFDVGAHRQLAWLFSGELPLGYERGTASQQIEQPLRDAKRPAYASERFLPGRWCEQRSDNAATKSRDVGGRSDGGLESVDVSEGPQVSPVYDLVNCGPRHRFLIRNADGRAFISHNSVAHGLNLQAGGSTVIWYSLTWSLEEFIQLNARVYRQGQKSATVVIHMLVCKDTIDEDVAQALTAKDANQNELLNALKR